MKVKIQTMSGDMGSNQDDEIPIHSGCTTPPLPLLAQQIHQEEVTNLL